METDPVKKHTVNGLPFKPYIFFRINDKKKIKISRGVLENMIVDFSWAT